MDFRKMSCSLSFHISRKLWRNERQNPLAMERAYKCMYSTCVQCFERDFPLDILHKCTSRGLEIHAFHLFSIRSFSVSIFFVYPFLNSYCNHFHMHSHTSKHHIYVYGVKFTLTKIKWKAIEIKCHDFQFWIHIYVWKMSNGWGQTARDTNNERKRHKMG